MANHSGHIVANCFFGGCLTSIFGLTEILDLQQLSIATSGFLAGTFLLSPDLDLYHSKVNKNWGIFRYIWLPYTLFFKHRGKSHHIFLGTLSRILYLFLLSYLILGFTKFIDSKEFTIAFLDTQQATELLWQEQFLTPKNAAYCTLFFIGIYFSDLCHLLMDFLYSRSKKQSKFR